MPTALAVGIGGGIDVVAAAKSAFCVQCLAVITFVAIVCSDADRYHSSPWLGFFLGTKPGQVTLLFTFMLGIGMLGPVILLEPHCSTTA